MEDSIIELKAYSVIIPIYLQPKLDIVEATVLSYLREAVPQTRISELLGFDIKPVIAELKRKEILNQEARFKYINKEDWLAFGKREYRKGFVFLDIERGMLFDSIIYSHELMLGLDEASLLMNRLGNDLVQDSILKKLYIINTFTINYNPDTDDANFFIRRLSEIFSECHICKEC